MWDTSKYVSGWYPLKNDISIARIVVAKKTHTSKNVWQDIHK